MKEQIPIDSITIIEKKGSTDEVYIYSNIPTPFIKGINENNLVLKFEAPRKRGVAFVKKHFPSIEPNIIDLNG